MVSLGRSRLWASKVTKDPSEASEEAKSLPLKRGMLLLKSSAINVPLQRHTSRARGTAGLYPPVRRSIPDITDPAVTFISEHSACSGMNATTCKV